MRTVQMTLDEELVEQVDELCKVLSTTRSEFTRNALRDALERMNARLLEEKHKRGYEKIPAKSVEFRVWESEGNWGD